MTGWQKRWSRELLNMPDTTETPTGPDGQDRRKATDRSELLAAASELKEATTALGEKFELTQTFSRETRRIAKECEETNTRLARWTKTLVAVVAVLAVTVGGVTYSLVRVANANDKASRNAEYNTANCELNNKTRSDANGLWTDITTLISSLNNSPGNKKFVKELKANVAKTYGGQRDCSKVEEGKVK